MKKGDLEFCDSDGNCKIHFGFAPERMFIDENGNYCAVSSTSEQAKGVVPFEWKKVNSYKNQKVPNEIGFISSIRKSL
jgi:hypothetical protein